MKENGAPICDPRYVRRLFGGFAARIVRMKNSLGTENYAGKASNDPLM